ncbi:MAG: tetratricopeptide repeat protein [Candidatus Marinimicrobia bacterium]|nr:tetratricopeptide repeat protein [Candidatus Neomarinimicrobiota bacterium]
MLNILSASSRIVYTRPGLMMRVPTSSFQKAPYIFRTGFGVELHNFDPVNTAKGVYFDMELGRGFAAGFSAVQGGDTTSLDLLQESQYAPQVEFGFHFQQRLFTYNDISLSAGLQDIVFQNNQDAEQVLSLNTDLLSFFLVLASEKDLGDYKMNTYMGFGSGGLGPMDSIKVVTDSTQQGNAGVFVGFLLKTPYFARTGGMDIVGEFDGTGVNVGLRIPLTSDYRLNLGFTHIERLPDWDSRYWTGHPAFSLGLDMAVPRLPSGQVPQVGPSGRPMAPGMPVPEGYETVPMYRDSTIAMADFAVKSLRDSISMMDNEMRNLMVQLSAKEQETNFLDDSLRSLKLDQNVSDKNMNEAMRHLSRSLRYFYAGDFRESLKEVDLALELQPDLALAYARRGSIYYKLGDVQRATINWNLALRLDPEYDDVRNILKALHENRLKTASMFEE